MAVNKKKCYIGLDDFQVMIGITLLEKFAQIMGRYKPNIGHTISAPAI